MASNLRRQHMRNKLIIAFRSIHEVCEEAGIKVKVEIDPYNIFCRKGEKSDPGGDELEVFGLHPANPDSFHGCIKAARFFLPDEEPDQ